MSDVRETDNKMRNQTIALVVGSFIVIYTVILFTMRWFESKQNAENNPEPFMFDTSYPTQMRKYSDYPTLSSNTPDGAPALVEFMLDGRLVGRKLSDGTWEGVSEDQAEKDWFLPKVDLE